MKVHRQAVRFALLFLPVGIACAIYLTTINATLLKEMGKEVQYGLLLISSLVQIALIYTFLLGYLGYQLTQRVGLMRTLSFNRATLKPILMLSAFSALIMVSDYYVFAPHIPQVMANYNKDSFTLVGLLFNMLYGGVIEEIMLRLFFLSLLVVMLDLLFRKSKQGLPIPTTFFYVSNGIAAVLFALGHLPATQSAFGSLSSILVIRSLVLNGVLGYLFGWIFIKFGIQWAMLTHALTHLFSQALLFLLIL